MKKLIIVDDSDIFRTGLKTILEQNKDIEVVGVASNGIEAYELCKSLSPHLVLMDVRMPVCDGIEGTKLIKESHPNIKVVILTTFEDEDYITNSLNFGADGYILKDIRNEDLKRVIESTINGFSVVQNSVFSSVRKQYKTMYKSGTKPNYVKELKTYSFSSRELEIMKMIVEGKNNRQIADSLFLAEGSVRNLISEVLSKTRLKDRTQLAVFAINNNIV